MMVMLLATVWMTLNTHCQLERLGFFPKVGCCATPDNDFGGDGGDDGCCDLDSAQYFSTENGTVIHLNIEAVLLPLVESELPQTSPLLASPRGPGPPVLLAGWQFSSRAALPPRAPSFAS